MDKWYSTHTYDTERLIGLYRTFSPIKALGIERRNQLLSELASVNERLFGGSVQRVFTTAL
jgi:hypothetical protein